MEVISAGKLECLESFGQSQGKRTLVEFNSKSIG